MNSWGALLLLLCAFLVLCSHAYAKKKVTAPKKPRDIHYLNRTAHKYMADTARTQPGVVRLKSGILVEILHSNPDLNDISPRLKDACVVSYTGWYRNGSYLDPTTRELVYTHHQYISVKKEELKPKAVITGLAEALLLMAERDRWRIWVPYELGAGPAGSIRPEIPGFAPLVFEVQLHRVKGKGKSAADARRLYESNIIRADDDVADLVTAAIHSDTSMRDGTSDANPPVDKKANELLHPKHSFEDL